MDSIVMHQLSLLSRVAALAFVAGVWQGAAVIAAVALCFRLLPGVGASVRFAVWGFAFVLLSTAPLLHLTTAAARQPHAPSAAMLCLPPVWRLAVAALWATLSAVRFAQLLGQAVHLCRVRQRAEPVALQGELAPALRGGGRRLATLCASDDVDSPCVLGFLSPRLLVPRWMFAKLTEAELGQVVLHECEHLRRCDDWLNLLQKIALALFPLNPALLWGDRRLSFERELACDARVVASLGTPFGYARFLASVAEYRILRRRVALSLSAWSRQSELARRVHALLLPARLSPLRTRVSIALLTLALGAGSAEMARVPSLVSFEGGAAQPAIRAASVHAFQAPYSPAIHARPKLLQASLRFAPASRALTITAPAALQPSRPKISGVRTKPVRRPPSLLLTNASSAAGSPRLRDLRADPAPAVYAVNLVFSPSYAAVPFGDGWLLVQL